MRILNIILLVFVLTLFTCIPACTSSDADTGSRETESTGISDSGGQIPEPVDETETDLEIEETDIQQPDSSSLTLPSDQTETPASDETLVITENGDEVTEDGDEGMEDGVTHTSSGEVPEGWPRDVPVMEGFTILQVTRGESDGVQSSEMTIMAQGDAPFDEIIGFYTTLEGWDSGGEQGMVVSDDESFFISITKGGDIIMINGGNNEAVGPIMIVLKYMTM